MSLRTFFRPTVSTVTVTLIATGISAFCLYYLLLCALNDTSGCTWVPFWPQLVLVIILWPWAACIRLLGASNIGIASILGIVLSGLWLFGVICCGRGIIRKITQRTRPRVQLKE